MWSIVRKLYYLVIIVVSANCFSAQKLKIAILDNFKYQNYVTTRYKDYYIEGLKIVQNDAKSDQIDIEYKIFQYNESLLSIYEQIPKLTEWKPDMVIGPRDSNRFLMLSPYFKGLLVLSPFATSISVTSMPNNFFSITLDDSVESKAIFNFIQRKYPGNNLIILSESDCKSCNDVSNLLEGDFQRAGKKINRINYLAGDAETISFDATQLKNSVIIL